MDKPDDETLRMREQWFDFYTAQHNVVTEATHGDHTCPCCGHLTPLGEREIRRGGQQLDDD